MTVVRNPPPFLRFKMRILLKNFEKDGLKKEENYIIEIRKRKRREKKRKTIERD